MRNLGAGAGGTGLGQTWKGPRGGRLSGGGGGKGFVTTSVMVFLACLSAVYVGGRLWQDSLMQKELVEARKSLLTKGPVRKALSVEEGMMKIEMGELQKREAMLQVELAEAKARGFVPITAGSSAGKRASSTGQENWLVRNVGKGNTSVGGPAAKGHDTGVPLLLGVVGISTRFADRPLRDAIRASWLPSGRNGLRRLEEREGIVVRFFVGHSPNRGDSSDRAIVEENSAHGDFLILDDHEEDDHDMAHKLKSFYAKAVHTWDAAFYVKMDDDVYLNVPGLVAVLKEYKARPRMYLGCMKSTEVVTDPNSKWYEPEWQKFGDGKMYTRHAAGPFHIVSRELAIYFAITRAFLHEYKHEDVSLGSWMLGLDVNFEDDRRLCCASAPEDECVKKRESGKACVAVYDWHCGGLCEAEKRMLQVHRHCSGAGSSGAQARAG